MNALPEPVLDFLTQFLLLDKILPPLPGLEPSLTARLLGIDPARYAAGRAALAAQTQAAAAQLADDPVVASLVDALPLQPGGTLLALGDSLTAEPHSWAWILDALLRMRRPAGRFQVINAGVPGDTTAQILARMPAVLATPVDLVVCLAGSNDVRRIGIEPGLTLVSPAETVRNLDAMHASAVHGGCERWVWMTPPGVDEARVAAHPFWQALGTRCAQADVAELAAWIRKRREPVVDIFADFGASQQQHLLLEDGLHPSLAGHQRIVVALLRTLVNG
jgi:lysophospholipase L1-like esterase